MVGTYDINGKLRAEINYIDDLTVSRAYFADGPGIWEPQGHIVALPSGVTVESYIEQCLEATLNYMRNSVNSPINYPANGWGINSNSWNQSIHEFLGGDTVVHDYNGIDYGNGKRVPLWYFRKPR